MVSFRKPSSPPFSQREKGEKPHLLRDHVPVRVIHRDVAKRRHLIFYLVPVANDHDRGPIGVKVFRRDALNIGGSQSLDPADESLR